MTGLFSQPIQIWTMTWPKIGVGAQHLMLRFENDRRLSDQNVVVIMYYLLIIINLKLDLRLPLGIYFIN